MTNDDWFWRKGPGRCFRKAFQLFESGGNTSPGVAIQGLRKQIKKLAKNNEGPAGLLDLAASAGVVSPEGINALPMLVSPEDFSRILRAYQREAGHAADWCAAVVQAEWNRQYYNGGVTLAPSELYIEWCLRLIDSLLLGPIETIPLTLSSERTAAINLVRRNIEDVLRGIDSDIIESLKSHPSGDKVRVQKRNLRVPTVEQMDMSIAALLEGVI